jgi:dihydroflavonol-4-reductase
LVEADLLKPETLDEAIKGCDFLVHTASPFPLKVPDDENVLVKPAVEGTMAAVRAAHKHRLKRVVITSSIVAIYA